MTHDLPAAALGHFVIKVDDIEASYQFYGKLGLRQCGLYPDLAIIELRGGTHILIFGKTDDPPFSIAASRLGQRAAFFPEQLDLMIEGKSRDDLRAYREGLIGKGLSVGEMSQDPFFGHDYFELMDPDGAGITVYSNHTGAAPV